MSEISESDLDALDDAVFGWRGSTERRISESAAQADARAVRRGLPTAADFQRVGLSESDSRQAARGLLEGHYLSVEDAAWSTATFSVRGESHVDQIALAALVSRVSEGGAESEAASPQSDAVAVTEADMDRALAQAFGRPEEPPTGGVSAAEMERAARLATGRYTPIQESQS